MFFVGDVRRVLMIRGSHLWNAWVRDVTARLEGSWLIRDRRHILLGGIV